MRTAAVGEPVSPPAPSLGSPFDRALQTRALMTATDEYASRYGEPGTTAYQAAWLRFRKHVGTITSPRTQRPEPPVLRRDVIRVLNAALRRAMLIDEAPMANAQLLDPQTQRLRTVAHFGFTIEFLELLDLINDIASAPGSAPAAGTAVWVADTTRSPIFSGAVASRVMFRGGSRAVASIPVTAPTGRLIGMLWTHHTQPVTWTDQRKAELQSVADSTGRLLAYLIPTAPENGGVVRNAVPRPGAPGLERDEKRDRGDGATEDLEGRLQRDVGDEYAGEDGGHRQRSIGDHEEGGKDRGAVLGRDGGHQRA
jgi:hypothetical protein